MSTLTPPSPAPDEPGASKRASGPGIAALVLGLVALLLGLIPFVGFGTWILGLVGVVLGIVGLVQRERRRGLPLAGLIVSAVAIVVGLVVSIGAVVGVASAVTQSLDDFTAGPAAVGGTTAPSSAATDAGSNASASWYTETYGSFSTKTVKGSGDDVIRLPKGAKGGLVVASYSGSGNFAVVPQDSANASTGELLVNTIGRYKGTTAWGLSSLGDATTLQVSASGKWTIVLKPMDAAKALPSKGSGDGVYKYTGGAATWAITHKGQSNFVVAEYSTSLIPNLAVNEIGRYRGRVPADAGPAVVLVTADGKWTIK